LQLEINLSAKQVIDVRLDGRELALLPNVKNPIAEQEGMACVSPDTPIRQLLQQMSHSVLPVLVLDDGMLCGVIRNSDVIAALANENAVQA